tara:strand:+ start:979 stop:1221 length:243 start_codon:yes stop_codon:yes gene_type:complete
MTEFLFRLSRLLSVILIPIIILLLTFFILGVVNSNIKDTEDWWFIIILTLGLFSIILIFNWLSFGKFSIWIKNPNKENIE